MQLFTHLLPSYLQRMGDFFSALPRWAEALRKCFRHNRKEPPPLGEGWGGAFYRPVCITRDHHWWFVTDETWAHDN